MSYQVLARKWRPNTFSQLLGQEHVAQALSNALNMQRLHHAYLFTGTRGIGKTSVARLLAKCLNCEQGITASPCGVCNSCVEIALGRSLDVIEVDAASRTKVEDTRDLLDNVQYAPSSSRFKIYLIDEVHMLSNHSFNALLKTLEEPPSHVKFLFATTEYKKLPVTVLSRCLRFNLQPLTVSTMLNLMQDILIQEEIPFEGSGLTLIANAAAGSMRDALSILDQAIAYTNKNITGIQVSVMLGEAEPALIENILGCIKNTLADDLFTLCDEIENIGLSYAKILDELLNLVHLIALYQVSPKIMESKIGAYTKVLEFSNKFSAQDLQLLYQILLMGRKDLNFAPQQKLGFSMLLLRCLAFTPLNLNVLQQEITVNKKEKIKVEVLSPVVETVKLKTELFAQPKNIYKENSAKENSVQESVTKESYFQHETEENNNMPLMAISKEKNQSQTSYAQTNNEKTINKFKQSQVSDGLDLRGNSFVLSGKDLNDKKANIAHLTPDGWQEFVDSLCLVGMLKMLAENCVLKDFGNNVLVLILDESQKVCLNPIRQEQLLQVIVKNVGQLVRLEIEIGTVGDKTPLAVKNKVLEEKDKERHISINNDENIQNLLESFDAQIEKVSEH